MDIERIREYCINLKGTSESFPFDKVTLVFKVLTKIYCLENLQKKSINIKARPEDVINLIEEHQGITPGYHMNKKHWITIDLEKITQPNLLEQLILNSYDLIIRKMTKKEKEELDALK